MSQIPLNPYTSTGVSQDLDPIAPSGTMAGGTKAIFIIHLILGILGVMGAIGGVISLALMPMLQEMMANQPGGGPKIDMNPFPGAWILSIVMLIVSTLISIGMIIGGITGLKYKLSGLNLIKMVSGIMILYKILEFPFNIVVQYYSTQAQKENMPSNPNGPDMSNFMDIMFYGMIAFGALITIGMIVFYAICFIHLSKAHVRANFN
jgi:hypothetical protein